MFLTRLSNLLCVKSIVTILLTLVFGYLTITNRVSGQDFLTIFSVVTASFIRTQSQRLYDNDTTSKGKS